MLKTLKNANRTLGQTLLQIFLTSLLEKGTRWAYVAEKIKWSAIKMVEIKEGKDLS